MHPRRIHTKPHTGLEWRVFQILSNKDVDDFTDTKLVSEIVLKFAGVSSKHLWVFLESLRQSSVIFGNFRSTFGNVRVIFLHVLENLQKNLEGGQKSSENRRFEYCSCHSNIKFISSRHRAISSIKVNLAVSSESIFRFQVASHIYIKGDKVLQPKANSSNIFETTRN